MDNKTKGSWIIHHTNKLQRVTSQHGYESIYVAGKAGILLSAISANHEMSLDYDKVKTLAEAAEINIYFELQKILEMLKKNELIDLSPNVGVSVLGITTTSALQHTANVFEYLNPSQKEHAVIEMAERASIEPTSESEISEELSDLYKLTKKDTSNTIFDAEKIGFVDVEELDPTNKLLFNGNLFRRESTKKIKTILDSLTLTEQSLLNELSQSLRESACIPVHIAKKQLGDQLFSKVTAIGLFDVCVVSNSTEEVGYLTLPSAFSKYSSSMVEDAFDLTKAFVSSITYGMTRSSYVRGQIRMVEALLQALVRGESVGPVQAIAEDYKILELKGVVKVSYGSKKGRYGPMLKLLKREVGELALQVIGQGDVSEHSLPSFPSAAVTGFSGPENNREWIRRDQVKRCPKDTNDMLSILRRGGGF
jgi:hypothetical protein